MAKVINPNDTFKLSKRLSKRILLKNRREGLTITFQSLTKKMVFFKTQHDGIIKTELETRYNALTPAKKQEWKTLGKKVLMAGETFYKQQEKKSMTQGFYRITTYGATRYKGIISTKYATLYNDAIYGVGHYRNK